MRFLKVAGLVMCVFVAMALASENQFGVREVNHITFDAVVHIGSTVLPAGEYVVRHTMEGQDHVMVFRHVQSKKEFKVKCTLVQLQKKIEKDQSVYELNANKELVLQELDFHGDTAKHVFQQ
ncbi:MAG TPA: hypothetical protein VMB66_03985 [Candidatus Acidoferrales bacterium]|nr:hypothetical protein [Candidatus Acidoferrales bacterium]